jgi:linoleoyl-CoA desaturase
MFLLGSNTFNWKVQHNILHHTFTNIYGYDQDIETKAVLRLCEHAPKKKFHRFQYIYAFFFYGLMTLSKLITDIFQLIEFNTSGITKEQHHNPKIEIIRLLFSKIIYFSIIIGLPILFTPYKWWQVLIGFFILHFTSGIIMSTVFQMAHVVNGVEQPLPNKNNIITNEWAVHQLRTTANFAKDNKLLNWYVGGLNFQIEHHLFPNICHIHYPKIAPIVEKTALDFGIAYNTKSTF